jgi:hypothetical protein
MNIAIFVFMKKMLVLFLCLQICSGNVFATECLKIPMLFVHFYEHQLELEKSPSFSDFLSEHYSNHSEENEAGHCHEKVPFKHCHECCVHQAGVVAFLVPEFTFSAQLQENLSLVYTQHPVFTGSTYSVHIWQPPRQS